jgi:hypothetical protein
MDIIVTFFYNRIPVHRHKPYSPSPNILDAEKEGEEGEEDMLGSLFVTESSH